MKGKSHMNGYFGPEMRRLEDETERVALVGTTRSSRTTYDVLALSSKRKR